MEELCAESTNVPFQQDFGAQADLEATVERKEALDLLINTDF